MKNLVLYGSITSPFVRRTRILLGASNYHFEMVNMMDEQKRAEFSKVNPLAKIPVLKDGDNIIFDSRQIYLYLAKKLNLKIDDSTRENNLLTIIDGATDALVILFYLKKSALDANKNALIVKNNLKRVTAALNYLNQNWNNRESWKYADICLFTLLDWILFRNLVALSSYSSLLTFHQTNQNQPHLAETAPKDS